MKRILWFPVIVLSLLLSGGIAQAQIVGQLDANIPFAFHAGLARFPAGKYIIRTQEGSDFSAMEIQSADGEHSALFDVRAAQSVRAPHTGELIFNHVGNRYYLAKIFDDGDKNGVVLLDTGYSKKYGAGLDKGEQKHVPILHSGS